MVAKEASDFKEKLEAVGVNVCLFTPPDDETPDAVFPNNWFSTHVDGLLFFLVHPPHNLLDHGVSTLVLYGMKTLSRRLERRPALIEKLEEALFFLFRKFEIPYLERCMKRKYLSFRERMRGKFWKGPAPSSSIEKRRSYFSFCFSPVPPLSSPLCYTFY